MDIFRKICYTITTVKGTPVLRMQAQSVADQAENSRTVPLIEHEGNAINLRMQPP